MVEKSTVRIMVLDDEPLMLKLLAHMLANQGVSQVTTCSSGRAALAHFDGSDVQPDLILLDLNMPEMDGVEFVRHLVDRSYGGSLVLISGEDERMMRTAERLVQAHSISVLGHLSKPVEPETLAELLDKWAPSAPSRRRKARKTYQPEEVWAAIENGELVNYYQPKVVVATGELEGVETLVRWRHPTDGMVFPDQFIGVAETHGLIDQLTRAVLTGALAQCRAWKEDGLRLRVAVNVSMNNLFSLDFADFIAAQAVAAGVVPQDVMLEVTESRLMQDARAPLETLTRLRLKRFRLSIDDFGTGHSSLAQLRDIPFDELKIDRGFVHRAWADDLVRPMYEASLGLARQLGMEVVAEGVEDANDWALLRRTGCDLAQGYFIGAPMPAEDLPAWMEAWAQRVTEL